MTAAKRVEAVIDYGFTERQARFLVLVMRHAGLCVKRQYAAFAGIANGGEKCSAFFEKLVRGGYAVASDCVHNRARLYHVHHKPLYHAIGDPESRYRRPVPARRAAERLMRLDAALTNPDLDWLTTRSEKVAYLKLRTAPESAAHLAEAMVQDVADLANLKRYFFHRRRGTDPTTVPESLRAFLERCAQVFAGPRFALLYRRWLTDGDAALSGV
ncbi:MAG: hypothetical protein HY655_02665, partial [Acidobacteria bacterium]|nr:hypothetical protein [Acidobacteriota bacterium]